MMKLRIPLHSVQYGHRMNTQRHDTQEENLQLSSASRSRSNNKYNFGLKQRSRNVPFVSGGFAATTGGRGATISSQQFSVQSSSQYNQKFNALYTQMNSIEGFTERNHEDVREQAHFYPQVQSTMDQKSWKNQAMLAQTQFSLKAKALDLHKLNMKSRNNQGQFQQHALTSRIENERQDADLVDWRVDDADDFGQHFAQTSRTVRELQVFRRRYSDSNPANSSIKPPPTILDSSSSFQTPAADSHRQNLFSQSGNLTLVRNKHFKNTKNKKEIGRGSQKGGSSGEALFRIGRASAAMKRGAIKGDGDEVEGEVEDGVGGYEAWGPSDHMLMIKESMIEEVQESNTIDQVVEDIVEQCSLLQEESVGDGELGHASSGLLLNDSDFKIKRRMNMNSIDPLADPSTMPIGDSTEQKQAIFSKRDSRKLGEQPNIYRANNGSTEISNGQSTILRVLQESRGDQFHVDNETNILPVGHSFGGHEALNKFTIQTVDNIQQPHQLFMLGSSPRNGSLGMKNMVHKPQLLAPLDNSIQVENEQKKQIIHDESSNPLDQIQSSEEFEQQESAFITINEPFEGSSKQIVINDSSNLVQQHCEISDNFIVPQTKTHSENTNDRIQQAVQNLIDFNQNQQKEDLGCKTALLQLVQNSHTCRRDSTVGQFEGRVAYLENDSLASHTNHSFQAIEDSSLLSELQSVIRRDQKGSGSSSHHLSLNRSLVNYRSLDSSRSFSSRSLISDQLRYPELGGSGARSSSSTSSNLKQLLGPIEPANLDKHGFKQTSHKTPLISARSTNLRSKAHSNCQLPLTQAPPLFSGTIYRYNYGFLNDFTPRYLVITPETLKYYRNEQHANNKKATNVPIVSVPISLIESIEPYRAPDQNQAKNSKGFSRTQKQNQQNLYQNMIQIKLREQSFKGGFYRLRQNEKVQDLLVECQSVMHCTKEQEGRGFRALSQRKGAKNRALQSECGFQQRTQSPYTFLFGKSLLERSYLSRENNGVVRRKKQSKSRLQGQKRPPQINIVKEEPLDQPRDKSGAFDTNQELQTLKQKVTSDYQLRPRKHNFNLNRQMESAKEIQKKQISGKNSQLEGKFHSQQNLLHVQSAGILRNKSKFLSVAKLPPSQQQLSRQTSKYSSGCNNIGQNHPLPSKHSSSQLLHANCQTSSKQQSLLTYSVSPHRLDKILKGPLIVGSTTRHKMDGKTQQRAPIRLQRSTGQNVKISGGKMDGKSRQKVGMREDPSPLLQQISASIKAVNSQLNLDQNGKKQLKSVKESQKIDRNKKENNFRKETSASRNRLLGPPRSLSPRPHRPSKPRNHAHTWNARLDMWDQGSRQLIFSLGTSDSKKMRSKLLFLRKKISKLQKV